MRSGQVRNSNAYTLHRSQEIWRKPRYWGSAGHEGGHGFDASSGLEADVVFTTGGVSMGRYDFVTEASGARCGDHVEPYG